MLSDPSGGFSSPPLKKENYNIPDNHFRSNKRYELFYSKGKKINSICILRNTRMVYIPMEALAPLPPPENENFNVP